ncbi:probable fibrosin-1 isoform X1 [Dermochelys coriacea]|uniref:probable fibrosin-1 isoform X1 n=1 Tax=Dermochelys coriacea TaxID=27794 RepID=UPI0018E73598|nr:probable fibrosin-1 isoform X1 [Dermochelys coriacea]
MEAAAAPAPCWSGGGGRARRLRRCSRRDRESRRSQRRGGRPGEPAHRGVLSSSSDSESEGPAPPAPVAPGKPRRRPLRRRTRPSGSSCSHEEEEEEEEEDLIDGFAIASFISLEALEKDTTLRTPERLEHRLKHSGKRKRDEGSGSEEEEGCDESSEKGCGRHAGERALRRRSKRRRKEASLRSYLETGYICDMESDPGEQASNDDLDQSFTVSTNKASGPVGAVNGSCAAKLSVIPKVSGLERSQERSHEADGDPLLVPFLPKDPLSQAAPALPVAPARPPTPPAPPPSRTPNPAAARTTPQPRGQLSAPQGGPAPHGLPQPTVHGKGAPFASPTPPGPYGAGLDLSIAGCSRSSAHAKPLLPPCSSSSQLPPRPSTPSLALPPHAFPSTLRPPTHHHPPLFPPSPGLPPPPPLLQVAGHPAAALSEQELIRQGLSSRFLTAQGGADMGAAAIRPLAFQFHQHNHQHQHTHQHTHQHFTPFPPGMVPGPAPAMFEKYPGKIDGLLRHNFYSTFPPTVSGIPPVLPPAVSFGSLQGAFQPKSTNPELPSRLGAVAPSLSQKGGQLTDPFRPSLRKPGKWCSMHVRVAYMILRHQERMKLMQGDPHKLDFRNDLITCLPGTGTFGSLAHGQELTRPATLFTPTGAVHASSGASFGPPSAPHSSFLGPSAHLDPFSRPTSFAALGALSNGAFGGLGNPAFNSSSMFGQKDSPGAQAYGSPHDPWNRLHRTPPSFPTAPAWPKGGAGDAAERGPSQHEKELDKREVPAVKDEKDRDTLFSRPPPRASPVPLPTKHPASLGLEDGPMRAHSEPGREQRYGSPVGGRASRSPYPDPALKKEVKVKEEPELGVLEGALRAGGPFPGALHVSHPLGALAVFERPQGSPYLVAGPAPGAPYAALEAWREPYALPRYLERELPEDYERARLYGLGPHPPGLLAYPRHATLLTKAPPPEGLLGAPPPLIPAVPGARPSSPRRAPDLRELTTAYKDRDSR